MNRDAILIYRTRLLALSEIFISRQAEALTRFTPFYVGTEELRDAPLPHNRVMSLGDTRTSYLRRLRAFLTAPSLDQLDALRELQPALIHAHFGPDAMVARVLARKLQIPLVITFHGYDINLSSTALLRQDWRHAAYLVRRKQLAASAAVVLAVSQFIADKLISKGFARNKIAVHYMGVDTDFFRPDPSVARERMILFVGRLVENKGCEYLLRAAAELQKDNSPVKLVIIGDGHLKPELMRLACQLQLTHCEFVGARPPQAVRDHMNRAAVFCVPSIELPSGASEGFGLVLSEAQSMGVPVVSFRTGGIPEAVNDGETGFLVTPRDTAGLAQRIALLLNSQSLWMRFSCAARDYVVKHFDLKKQTAKLEAIYDCVIHAKPAAAGLQV